MRKVTLRSERDGADSRYLWASVDKDGRLHIEGQDLGPGTGLVSGDGEYEWDRTIAAADIPRVVALLGGGPGEDVLQLLDRAWSGPRSYDLEARLRDSDIPSDLWVWSG